MTKEQIIKDFFDKKITAIKAVEALKELRKDLFRPRKYSVIDRQHESINPLEFI